MSKNPDFDRVISELLKPKAGTSQGTKVDAGTIEAGFTQGEAMQFLVQLVTQFMAGAKES